MSSFPRLAPSTLLLLFVIACSGELQSELPRDELSIFLELSHDLSFEEACAEIAELCETTGRGCEAHEFFCAPSSKEEWVCLRLHYACRDGERPSACETYQQRCIVPGQAIPTQDGAVPVPLEPDAGPAPEPDAALTPEPDAEIDEPPAQPTSDYEVNVKLPSCSAPDALRIRRAADFDRVDDKAYRIFCVEPGDYSSRGLVKITSSGTADEKRYLIFGGGGERRPWKRSKADRAILKQLELNNAKHWVVEGLTITDPSYSLTKGRLLVLKKNSDHNLFTNLLVEKAKVTLTAFTTGSDHNTIQRSVLRGIHHSEEAFCVSVYTYLVGAAPEHRGVRHLHVVGNEMVDCTDGVQVNGDNKDTEVIPGAEGLVIADNDIYVTNKLYTNCNGKLDPKGQCSCAENAIDLKVAVTKKSPGDDEIVRLIGNRMWGFRYSDKTAGTVCGNVGSFASAIIGHWQNADHVYVRDNIIVDSENGIGVVKSGPDHWRLVNNLIYDTANKLKVREVFDLSRGRGHVALLNAAIDATTYLRPGGADVRMESNLLIRAGKSLSGDFTGSSRIGSNNYFATTPYSGADTKGDDAVYSSASAAEREPYCFTRKRLTAPEQFCIPDVRPTTKTPPVKIREPSPGLNAVDATGAAIYVEPFWG